MYFVHVYVCFRVVVPTQQGRVGSFVYGSAWWTLTLVHTALLSFFTLLNLLWVSYAIIITFVTKELDYHATDFVYFSGPSALAAVALPSVLYLVRHSIMRSRVQFSLSFSHELLLIDIDRRRID